MPSKLVIFDLDMTLVDSREDIAASVARALKMRCGVDLLITDVFPFIGSGLADTFRGLAPEADEENIRACVREYRRWFYDHCHDRSRLYDGVQEGLAQLRSKGFLLAVATAKNKFMAYRVLGSFGLTDAFDIICGADGLAPKPDPAIVHSVCKSAAIHPMESVMIGDTTMDVLAGQGAGAKTIAVTYGIGDEKELKALNPDFISPDFNSVLGVLFKLRKH
jgi:phosphoglycolate phosphatase